MRKISIVVLALALGLFTFLFIRMPAFGHSYPDELPKNFKNAPEKTICRQKVSPYVFQEEYKNPVDGWKVIISGRGKKEIYIITFAAKRRNGQVGEAVSKSWWNTSEGWKMYNELWGKQLLEANKFSSFFDEKMWKFLDGCENKKK